MIVLIAVLAFTLTLVACTMPESKYVKVSFFVDGIAYESYWIENGASLVEEPEVPDKEGMRGVWNITNFEELQSDLRVDAVYESVECSVTFKVDAEIIATVKVKKNSTLTQIPEVPEVQGFDGAWNYTGFSNIDQDLTVFAVYTPTKYIINFYDGNVLYATRNANYGETLTNIPDLPSTNGNLSAKWLNENNEIPTFKNIKSDNNIHAYYYLTITLSDSYLPNDVLTFDLDEEIDAIEPGQRPGYDFYGWYYDAELTQKVEPIAFDENCQIYARWLKTSNSTDFTFSNGQVTGYTGTDTN
ncbi:MAG TPA: InlB B-repeat-containing protein, partial [Clostridia bacterium]|nr:InlB B-repeat-containing protein [Clostridia bacterium]